MVTRRPNIPNPEIITEGMNLGVIKVHKEPELEPEHIRPELKGSQREFLVQSHPWYNHTLNGHDATLMKTLGNQIDPM